MQTVSVDGQPLTPSKIICVGRNYVAHIEELGNEVPDDMVVFLKPNSAIGTDLRSRFGEPLHYEAEIAFVVDKGQLAAVGLGLDLTRRQLQSQLKAKGLPWERAKAFNGAAVFSDFVALAPGAIDTLGLELEVDGVLRQQGDVSLMLYPPQVIVEQLASFLSLEDGDIIMTGTPAGVGEVVAGATFSGHILQGQDRLLSVRWLAQ